MKRILFVDGYNVLGAWDALRMGRKPAEAREALCERLAAYAGYCRHPVVAVFDAWQSGRGKAARTLRGSLEIVYTGRGETADAYIERRCHEYASRIASGEMQVTVATSDAMERTIAAGRGATCIGARELIGEIERSGKTVAERMERPKRNAGTALADRLPEEIRSKLEAIARGEK